METDPSHEFNFEGTELTVGDTETEPYEQIRESAALDRREPTGHKDVGKVPGAEAKVKNQALSNERSTN